MFKLELVDNLNTHLKRFSIIALGILAALQAAYGVIDVYLQTFGAWWVALDPALKDGLPENVKSAINLGVALFGLLGGLLKQNIAPKDFFAAPKDEGPPHD